MQNQKLILRNYETLDEFISVRNKAIRQTFEMNGYAVKLIGDKNQPKVVILNDGEIYATSTYVRNHLFFFCNIPFNGNVLSSVVIGTEYMNVDREFLEDQINKGEKRPVWFIELQNSAFSYFDNNGTVTYNDNNPRFFLSEDKLKHTINTLKKHGYNPNVCTVW